MTEDQTNHASDTVLHGPPAKPSNASQSNLDFLHRLPERPARSTITITINDQSVLITIPPVGLLKSLKRRLGYVLVMLLVLTGFTIIIWLGRLSITGWVNWGTVGLTMTVFWGLTIYNLVVTIDSAHCVTSIEVTDNVVSIAQSGLFSKLKRKLDSTQITVITRSDSLSARTEDNVKSLNIRLNDGEILRLLDQLSDKELSWLALVLREVVGVREL